MFHFIQQVVLGLFPAKKSVRYRTMCMLLLQSDNCNAFVYVLVLHILTENTTSVGTMFSCFDGIPYTFVERLNDQVLLP